MLNNLSPLVNLVYHLVYGFKCPVCDSNRYNLVGEGDNAKSTKWCVMITPSPSKVGNV